MKTISRLSAAIIASAVLSTAGYSEDRVVKRIDHPNGPDTFAYVPADRAANFGGDVTVAYPASRERVVLVPERRVLVPIDPDLRRSSYSVRREVVVERW